MRLGLALLLAACLGLPALADSHDTVSLTQEETAPARPGQHQGIYRFGATYEFSNTASADDCQKLCNTRPACFAWSYIQAFDTGSSRCELKRGAGKAEYNPRAVSGISSSHEDQFQPLLQNPEELAGGSDMASPPSDKPVPLTAEDPV